MTVYWWLTLAMASRGEAEGTWQEHKEGVALQLGTRLCRSFSTSPRFFTYDA
jgi:hypothetical protein